MGPFEMVVLIVLICVGAGVIENRTKHKASQRSDGAHEASLEQMQSDIARLKERVRVLEKITTDSDAQLRSEISRLA
jgi:flagellar motility protein MotE (MotC chaperone)